MKRRSGILIHIAAAIMIFLVAVAIVGSIYNLMQQASDIDNGPSDVILNPNSPTVSLRTYRVMDGNRKFVKDATVMAWRASDSEPYQSYIGEFQGRASIKEVYRNGAFSLVEVSDEYYTAPQGKFIDDVKQPPKNVQISGDGRYEYNLFKVVEPGNMTTEATDSLGTELANGSSPVDYTVDMSADDSTTVIVNLRQPVSKVQYNAGGVMVEEVGEVEVSIQSVSGPSGKELNISKATGIDQTIELGNATFYDYDKMASWKPVMLNQGQTVSMTLKMQTGNTPSEGDLQKMSGAIIQFVDNDWKASINKVRNTHENTGFPENLAHPGKASTGTIIRAK